MNNTTSSIPDTATLDRRDRRAELEAKDDSLSNELVALGRRNVAISENYSLDASDRATLQMVNKVKQIKLERAKCRVAAQIATLDAREAMAQCFNIF